MARGHYPKCMSSSYNLISQTTIQLKNGQKTPTFFFLRRHRYGLQACENMLAIAMHKEPTNQNKN